MGRGRESNTPHGSVRALRALAVAAFCVATASACLPGDPGWNVTIVNRCDHPVRVYIGGGLPQPSLPSDVDEYIDTLMPDQPDTGSMPIDTSEGFVQGIDTASPAVATFSRTSDGSASRVELAEAFCT